MDNPVDCMSQSKFVLNYDFSSAFRKHIISHVQVSFIFAKSKKRITFLCKKLVVLVWLLMIVIVLFRFFPSFLILL